MNECDVKIIIYRWNEARKSRMIEVWGVILIVFVFFCLCMKCMPIYCDEISSRNKIIIVYYYLCWQSRFIHCWWLPFISWCALCSYDEQSCSKVDRHVFVACISVYILNMNEFNSFEYNAFSVSIDIKSIDRMAFVGVIFIVLIGWMALMQSRFNSTVDVITDSHSLNRSRAIVKV